MKAAQSNSADIPSITGTSNMNVKALPGSVSSLVIIHAVLLAGSFLLLFPIGVVALRWFGSFKFHWLLQISATSISIVGLFVAIAFSVLDPEFMSFDKAHQIIGIVVIVILVLQAALGFLHHRDYQKLQRRTWISYAHLWIGRGAIVLGMFNTVPYVKLPCLLIYLRWGLMLTWIRGFLLTGSTGGAIGVAILALIICAATSLVVSLGRRRHTSRLRGDLNGSSHMILTNFETSPGR